MLDRQCYNITKIEKVWNVVYFDYQKVQEGFHVNPKNQMQYDGITVNRLIIIKPTFIEKLLKKKVKKKLELYLRYIVGIIDSDDDSDSGALNEVLNELNRYKNILLYKYQKYLGEEYVSLMTQKIELLEYELKLKVMEKVNEYSSNYVEEEIKSRNR